MTGRNSLSFKLIKPTGEQAIARNIPDGGNDINKTIWKWLIFWTAHEDMKVEMIPEVK